MRFFKSGLYLMTFKEPVGWNKNTGGKYEQEGIG
jgi:hypothetical protein